MVSHTGHSLGAALAEICAWENEVFAVTFDSPGVRKHIERILGRDIKDICKVNIIGYLSEPNLVNTLGNHIGIRLRVYPRRELLSLLPKDNVWLQLNPMLGDKNISKIQYLLSWYVRFQEFWDPKFKAKQKAIEDELFRITREVSYVANVDSHSMSLIKGVFNERTQ